MSGVVEIRDGLQARIQTISGLITHDVIPQVIVPPCAIVIPKKASYEQAMGVAGSQLARHFFEVTLLAESGDFPSAQNQIDRWLAATSTGGIYGAIAGDRTLGGRVITSFIDGYREYEIREFGALQLLGCIVDVEVWSS